MNSKRTHHIWLFPLFVALIAVFWQSRPTLANPTAGVITGHVTDSGDLPIANAVVEINGARITTGDDGSFALEILNTGRVNINANMIGYAPFRRIYNNITQIENLHIVLPRAQEFIIEPQMQIELKDERGTQISIPAGGLVDETGQPASTAVSAYLYTFDTSYRIFCPDKTFL